MTEHRTPASRKAGVRLWAHVVERSGLALTGAACGLFVAAYLGKTDFDVVNSVGSVLVIMVYGAIGFYLGIDLPSRDRASRATRRQSVGFDIVELLSAAGTFITSVSAIASVSGIILDDVSVVRAILIGVGWVIGASMQSTAGVIARLRLEDRSIA